MKDKRQIHTDKMAGALLLFLIIFCTIAGLIIDSIPKDIKGNDYTTYKGANNQQGNFNSGSIIYYMSDFKKAYYTEEAFQRVYVTNQSKFIYLECVNSTMRINNNKLECVKSK